MLLTVRPNMLPVPSAAGLFELKVATHSHSLRESLLPISQSIQSPHKPRFLLVERNLQVLRLKY